MSKRLPPAGHQGLPWSRTPQTASGPLALQDFRKSVSEIQKRTSAGARGYLTPALFSLVMDRMKRKKASRTKIPGRFTRFGKQYPAVMRAYQSLGAATQEAGPLSSRERSLAKLAIAVGARMEGAVHSHTRRALEAGCTAEEIRHVVVLATTTLGFPGMTATLSWVDDVLD